MHKSQSLPLDVVHLPPLEVTHPSTCAGGPETSERERKKAKIFVRESGNAESVPYVPGCTTTMSIPRARELLCPCPSWRLSDDELIQSPERTMDRWDILRAVHPLAQDRRLVFFEEEHYYTWDDVKVPTSVTEYIGGFSSPFEPEVAVRKMRQGRQWESKSRLYTHEDGSPMTDPDIIAKWERGGTVASRRGTLMHYTIEQCLNGRDIHDPSPEFVQFLEFERTGLRGAGFVPYRTELSMYLPSMRLAGQADLLAYSPDRDEYAVFDWKRTREVKGSNPFEHFGEPLEDLQVCNYNKYALQLNIYRYVLHKVYGMKITLLRLGIFHPEQHSPVTMDLPLWDRRMQALFEPTMLAQEPARVGDVCAIGHSDEDTKPEATVEPLLAPQKEGVEALGQLTS